MDEQAMIASARAGNAADLGELIGRYQDMAYSVAYRILGHPDAAADATQEAFLSAYRALAAYRGGSFRAWLLRIVTNACYDQLRLKKRRPLLLLDDMIQDDRGYLALSDWAEDPEEAALRRDLVSSVEAGLATLSWEQRVVVVLSDVQGLSYHEIAAVTGASLGAVKSRLNRARARLRDYLASN